MKCLELWKAHYQEDNPVLCDCVMPACLAPQWESRHSPHMLITICEPSVMVRIMSCHPEHLLLDRYWSSHGDTLATVHSPA